MTDELRRSNGGLVEMVRVPLGAHLFGADFLDAALGWPTWTLETARRMFSAMGPWVLAAPPPPGENSSCGSRRTRASSTWSIGSSRQLAPPRWRTKRTVPRWAAKFS